MLDSPPHRGHFERRGAPVTAFTRIDREYILIRTGIYNPSHVIVLDPSLIGQIDPTQGLEKNGWLILNAPSSILDDRWGEEANVAAVNASEIAVRHGLGTKTSPIVNTAILGATLAVTKILKIESLEQAIEKSVPERVKENVAAARDAYREVRMKNATASARN